jgi:hypothetical protein
MKKLPSVLITSLAILLGSMYCRAELANVALNGVPAANADLYGNASISKLVDGDKQNVFHGNTALPDGFAYTLDLGKNYAVTQLKIYPRQDGCCAERLTDFRVSVHGTNEFGEMGAEVWGADQFADGSNPPSTNGSLVTINLPSPQTGRWIEVRSLKSPVPDYSLQMTELEVIADVPASEINRAVGAVATANQKVYSGQSVGALVDGNRQSLVHGEANLQPGFAFTINLGVEVDMTKIQIVPRQDGCCPERLSNYRVSVYKDAAGAPGTKVWSADLHTDLSNLGSDPGVFDILTSDLDPAGQFKGQWVVIESLDDPVPSYALQIGEVEVYGTAAPGVKLLITKDLQDLAVGVGLPATFSIGVNPVNGTTNLLSYQWLKNGTAISAATNATYITPAILSADEGAKYKVIISYPGQTNLTSHEAVLKINYALHADAFANAPLYAGWNVNKIANGDRSDVFHGDVNLPTGFAYQVKMAAPIKISSIDIYPRQDGCCPERLSNFRVTLYKDTNGAMGEAVWTADLFTDGTNPGATAGSIVHLTKDLDPAGTFEGQWIEILSLDDPVANYSLQMNEMEVYGTLLDSTTKLTIPLFPSSVLGAPGRSSSITVTPSLFNGDASKLTFQWKKNGVPVSNATSNTFATGLLQDSDANSKYSVVVSYPGIPDVESSQAAVFFDYNYARGSTASANQLLWVPGNWKISMLVDGDTNGVFHGNTGLQPGFAYTVNLGDAVTLDKIDIYPRQDPCCPERFTNLRVSVHNDNKGQIGDSVWSTDLFTDGTNPGSGPGTLVTLTSDLDPAGSFKGQWIKIESLEDPVQDYALQMTELAAIGHLVPALRLNVVLTQTGPTITWSDGILEQVENIGDTWTVVTGAVTPFAIPKDKPHRFYRLKK